MMRSTKSAERGRVRRKGSSRKESFGIPSLIDVPGGKLKSNTTRRLDPSLGTVCSGEVRIGVGNGLYLKGPAVAECASSVDKKESIASGKRTDEEWLGGEGVEEIVEEKLIGQPKARKSATTESE